LRTQLKSPAQERQEVKRRAPAKPQLAAPQTPRPSTTGGSRNCTVRPFVNKKGLTAPLPASYEW